jgi:sugar lactone lactonase YvrE
MSRELPKEETVGSLELVYKFDQGPMPTGVAVSRCGRIFVNFPRWPGSPAEKATVAEIRDEKVLPFPEDWNTPTGNDDENALVSVQSVVVDPADRLWILDTGRPGTDLAQRGGPKLVCVHLNTNKVVKKIVFEPEVALPTTYLNDVRFDLRRGKAGIAYITDSSEEGPNGIIVVDLHSEEAWRRLRDHPSTKAERPSGFLPIVEGQPLLVREGEDSPPKPLTTGVDGVAITADGARIWYCPLASRRWYSVSADALANREIGEYEVERTVIDEGDKGGAADGLEADNKGRIYATNWEHSAILRRLPDGEIETLVHDPRLLWPDTLAVAEGWLYVTANQLHRRGRFHGGKDKRKHPYALFKIPIDAGPVPLVR